MICDQFNMPPVAILAGGLATRLHPITEAMPKALVSVAGESFIFRQLDYLREERVKKVVICLGHLGWMIEDIVGCGDRFGLEIKYSHDGGQLLGTGGAIKKAIPILGENFFILYGDSFLPINFLKVASAYRESQQKVLMTIIKNEGLWDASNVLYLNKNLIRYNKRSPSLEMKYIDYGLSIVNSSIFDKYPEHTNFDLADVYSDLSESGCMGGYEVFERFYEIGSHQGLSDAVEFFYERDKLK